MKPLNKKNVYPVYKELYADKIKFNEPPSGVDWVVFDFCVNSGVSRAAKALQGIVSATKDGLIGGKTITALDFDVTFGVRDLETQKKLVAVKRSTTLKSKHLI